ncbi:ATP-binding protein [Streptomyces candidus]|uniref:Anti-sigma regulatory factor (Ser/Thr protein kinase) n=1 Tax=Streptomyces candidus TaxID=67283 RepID=A0A7X0HG16_9ACTN|nr:ATP-binding protein [Streptomyces candidus]MBB6436940.1 anti-sigma regulatory factor (Ser/Thr protein kinase) [Streptomyces candidus]
MADMDGCRYEVTRRPWELPFLAEPCELAGLRRVMRLHLTMWGLPKLIEVAQACVTELAANVVAHVGTGTPATLAVAMRGTNLRIEMRDPDGRALPTLLAAMGDAESGRGIMLIDALAKRWGVEPREGAKSVWCELDTELTTSTGHVGGEEVTRAESHLALYERVPGHSPSGLPGAEAARDSAVALIADLLHWLRAHGCDPDEALDKAQICFEAEAEWGQDV